MLLIENLKITEKEITFDRVKRGVFGSEVKYSTRIMNFGDWLTISKIMYVNGKFKSDEVVHIPTSIIDKLKELKIYEE